MLVGELYEFLPVANDANGDPLTFSIEGQPGWADFDLQTGSLSGTPADQDVGEFSDIVLSVSDGQATSSLLPFSIDVESNVTPTINGTAPASVIVR